MEPSEFTNPKYTVFKYEQCITEGDLKNWVDVLVEEADSIPEGYIYEKEKILLAAKVIATLHDWIVTGKHHDYKGLI